MTAIISMLAVLVAAGWFYRTAEHLGLPGLAWAIGGVLVYYGGFLLWMYAVLPAVLGNRFQTHGFWLGVGMDMSAILFGTLCVVLCRFKVLMRKGRKPLEPIS